VFPQATWFFLLTFLFIAPTISPAAAVKMIAAQSPKWGAGREDATGRGMTNFPKPWRLEIDTPVHGVENTRNFFAAGFSNNLHPE
jgi:hypothetical protein